MSVISSPGTPDLPEVERCRLEAAAGVSVKATAEHSRKAGPAAAPPKTGQAETTGTVSPDHPKPADTKRR